MKNGLRIAALLVFGVFLVSSANAQEKTAAGLYNEGLALLKTKDYKGGLVLLEQALEKAGDADEKVSGLAKKNGAIAAYNAGNADRKAGSLDAALEMYNKGIALNPENSSNYEGLARTYEAQNKKVDAVTAYLDASAKGVAEGKADRAASRAKQARTIVGKAFVGKDYDLAVAAGNAFIEAKDDDAEVHYYVARSLAEKGDAATSISHIEKAISLAGDTADDKYHYAHATQLEAIGKKAEAIAAYQKITGEKYKKQADYKISELKG